MCVYIYISQTSAQWRHIWKLRLPNAEKNFIWRACKEILPTKNNLYRRKIVEDALCPICGLEEETSLHILWDCPSARDVWRTSIKKIQKSSIRGSNFMNVVEESSKIYDEEELCSFIGTARRVWFHQNEAMHGGSFTHPSILIQHATIARKEFVEANDQAKPDYPKTTAVMPQWSPPLQGWVKLNWDASLCSKSGLVCMGGVIQNWQGRVLAARCSSRVGFFEPLAAEAWAAG